MALICAFCGTIQIEETLAELYSVCGRLVSDRFTFGPLLPLLGSSISGKSGPMTTSSTKGGALFWVSCKHVGVARSRQLLHAMQLRRAAVAAALEPLEPIEGSGEELARLAAAATVAVVVCDASALFD